MKSGILKENRILRITGSYAVILIASALYAAGVSLFLDPNNLAPGGITGIAVILNRFLPVSTGILYLCLNVPVVILGLWKFGWRFMSRTTFAVIMTSVFTDLFSTYGAISGDLLLCSLAGGILMAVGIGLVFKAGGTTGGSDIIIKVLKLRWRHLKTGFLFQCFDFVVVAVSGVVFQDIDIMLYALLTVFVCGKALDFVLYGGDEAELIYIVTDRYMAIALRIMNELDAGCTFLDGKGAWTGNDKKIIMTVVSKKLGPSVEEIVRKEDSAAFMIETNANEIYGEGYKDIFSDPI